MAETVVAEEKEEADFESKQLSKDRLQSLIDRYYLGGNVEHVKWEIEDNTLKCEFISSDQSLVGDLEVYDFPLEDSDVGIYDTSKLRKLIKILDDEINVDVNYAADKAEALYMEDSHKQVDFRLGELSIIPDAPSLKQLPDFELDIVLTEQFIDNFTDSERALKDSSTFAVESDGSEINVILGYSEMGNTNKVYLHPEANQLEETDTTMFDSSVFSEILSANEDAEEMRWEVSSQGLSRITFSDEGFDLTYYFVAKSEAV